MIKNFIDYNLYVFKYKKLEIIIIFIDLILFIISACEIIKSSTEELYKNNMGINIILVGVLIKFVYDVYNMINEVKSFMELRYGELEEEYQSEIYAKVEIDEINNGNKYEIIKIPIKGEKIKEEVKEEEKEEAKKEEKVARVAVSYEINKKLIKYSNSRTVYLNDEGSLNNLEAQELVKSKIKIIRDKDMEGRIKDFIKDNLDDLLPFLKFNYRLSNFYGKMFFNEKKFCISGDIDISEDGEANIRYHKGGYYDTYLTNIISGKDLISTRDSSVIASTKNFMPVREKEDKYYLRDITSACMNNEVGISTLAITSDNYLVIWTQNKRAQSSGGLLVPTGSGSCDFADVEGDSFERTIKNGMERELWEENGGIKLSSSYKEIGETKIIGYFRWIQKGGKSEFVGLTKLKYGINKLYQDKNEVYDKYDYKITDIDSLKNVISELIKKDNLSIPLFMNLKALEEYIEIEKIEQIDRLWI